MPHRFRVVAFDLDEASLLSLEEAFPEGVVEAVNGATAASLAHDWNPGRADLLVVRARDEVAETLGLCRFLVRCSAFSTDARGQQRNQGHRADAPLLVLVPEGQESLVSAAFEAGAGAFFLNKCRPSAAPEWCQRQPGRLPGTPSA